MAVKWVNLGRQYFDLFLYINVNKTQKIIKSRRIPEKSGIVDPGDILSEGNES